MDGEAIQVMFLAWLTFVGLTLVAEVARGRLGGPAALVATWFVMAGLTLAVGGVAAFVGCHILLFAFGEAAAGAGIVASTVLLAVSPVAWAVVVWRRAHRGLPTGPGAMQPRAHG